MELSKFVERDCALVGVCTDRIGAHKAWCEAGLGRMRFPMVGDVSRQLANAFGVLTEQGVALRATFIIDPEGVVQNVSVNSLNVGRSAKETLRTLDALRSGGLTACEWQRGDDLLKVA